MEKTDAKVRLFLELSHQHPIQILNYLPLKPFDEWNPERMYEHPKDQYYYAFINDNELIYRIKNLFDKNYEDIQDISNQIDIIKSDLKMSKISIEFNGCNIETFDDLESNKLKIPLINNNNEDINNINVINNQEEERYAVFIRFFFK